MALTARAHDCGPEPSLRTGLGGPPVVILVRLRLPSDSLGRIEVARSQGHRADGLPASWSGALLGCTLVTSAAGPAEWRPRGRPYSAYASVGVWAGVAFANMGSCLLVVPRTFLGGRGVARVRHCLARADPSRATALEFKCRSPFVGWMKRINAVRLHFSGRQAVKKNSNIAATREASSATTHHPRVSSTRPPARPAWSGPRKIFHHSKLRGENPKKINRPS